MRQFISRFRDRLVGVLRGFDRLRFRGSLLLLSSEGGMSEFLWRNKVLLKDFKGYVRTVTERVRQASQRIAQQSPAGEVIYLRSTRISKEDCARELAIRHDVRQGLIAVLGCVEPCRSFDIVSHRASGRLRLSCTERQCLHHYFYFQDRQFGLMHVRLQTWFPFSIHVNLNGREWLARQLDAGGIGYVRKENCFVDIENIPQAQRIMDRQLRRNWVAILESLRRRVHPEHSWIVRACPLDYYWTVAESEWATDLMFRSSADLARLYPRLLRLGALCFSSRDVLRFLGRRVPAHGGINGHFQGEVVSDLRQRAEGVRIKHRVKGNSIKVYDKQGSVLRVETTVTSPGDFRVYRAKQADPEGAKDWRPLRKSVADLHRRARVSDSANQRYLEALATADDDHSVGELGAPVCQPAVRRGRRHRALNPLNPDDARLLQAVASGEFAVNGFRNRDLRPLLCGTAPASPKLRRRQSAQITRKLSLLRAHGLIARVPRTHRYQLTAQGRTTINTLLVARETTAKQLLQAA